MIRFLLAAACALALWSPAALAQVPYTDFDQAPADQPEDAAAQAAWRSWSARSAAALAETGQARERAFAAVLRSLAMTAIPPPDSAAASQPASADARAAAWRANAAAHAGSDVLANALLSNSTASPDIRVRAAQRWLGAEPQNLAPLLVRGGSVDALLADARTADRFDLGMLDQVRWMQRALLRTPPTPGERAALAAAGDFEPAEHAAMQAMALWTTVALPALQPLARGCAADQVDGDAARLQDCRHVAHVMADRSDTQLGQIFGLSLLEELAATPAERAGLLARRRLLDWRMLEWGRATSALPRDGAGQFVRLLADPSIRTESDLIARALQEAGVASEPPENWQPPR